MLEVEECIVYSKYVLNLHVWQQSSAESSHQQLPHPIAVQFGLPVNKKNEVNNWDYLLIDKPN